MFRSAAIVLSFCLVPALGFGQQTEAPADSVKFSGWIPEVVVEAPRPVSDIGGAAAFQAEIDSLPLPAAPTMEEVLREIPLLHVRTNSRGEAELSARGSESRQVAVLVDGIPITLAWDARADVSVIPATALQDVTFIRGLSSMLYGPNVLGGVVETRMAGSRTQPERTSVQVTMGTDQVGTYGTSLTTTVPLETEAGQALLRGGLAYRNTPGDPLAEKLTEPVNGGDGLRLNTDAENLSGFLAARYAAESGAWASLSGSSFTSERGVPAELGVADDEARLWRYPHVSRTVAILSGGTGFQRSPWGGRGDLEASFGIDRGRSEIDAYTSRSYDEIDTFENGEDRTTTLRLLADQTLGPRSDLRGAFTLADIHHDEIVPQGNFEYQQRLWSFGLENIWRLTPPGERIHSLALNLGGAYDVGDTPKSGGREPLGQLSQWGGRIGLSAVLGPGRTILHGGVSRRGRFPALRELYSGALNRFAPNPDLEPEKLITTEVGFTTRLPRGELQIVGFHNQLHDAVVRVTLEDRRFMRVNRDRLESTGLEVYGTFKLGPIILTGEATAQNVDLTDPTAGRQHRPENLPDFFGKASAQFPLVRGLRGGAAVDYTGRQFCIDPATDLDRHLAGQALVSAHLSRTWRLRSDWRSGILSQLEARIGADNIGDVVLYDACGLPEPGRRIRFELTVH